MTDQPDAQIKAEYGNDFVAAWLEELKTASDEEKDWREDADKASKVYRGVKERKQPFNIFHANIETLVPAAFNSTPAPDVRRRYADKDPTGKIVSDILERAISYSVDTYDFNDEIRAGVQDMAITDRGIARVRYQPYFGKDGNVASEDVTCEYVPWRSFRRGPARLWKDVPWIAFEHFLSKEQVAGLANQMASRVPGVDNRWDTMREEISFTYSAASKDDKDERKEAPRFGKRAHVWEIWDKDERKVIFLCPTFGREPITVLDDPLGLEQFFPIPRPMMAIMTTDSLCPVTPYSIYEDLLEELNKLTRRINSLIGQCRARGWYAAVGNQDEFKEGVEADDGELVPLRGVEHFATTGTGLDKAIAWFPLEAIVATLKQLVEQREIIKQIIFEISGMADVMRGQVDPQEKLGQTQIKAQWGGLRVQKKQEEVGRFVRDLFRLKAEVIAKKFSMQTLLSMTGIELQAQAEKDQIQQTVQQVQQQVQAGQMPPEQAQKLAQDHAEDLKKLNEPSLEDVEKLLRTDTSRGYQIDIESDSHIRGDVMRIQQQMAMFIQGTAAFVGAIGPLVQQGAMPGHIAIEIFNAFARHYKLGKQAEDALDAWADETKQGGGEQEKKEDPKLEAAKAQAEADKQRTELQMKSDQQKHDLTMQKMQGEAALGQAKLAQKQQELQVKQEEAAVDAWTAQQEAAARQMAIPGWVTQ